ncbi:uncharacterized protein LOC107025078 [Solanum pennellii]|uniref:Uncharacterized protein LOC107025078 n=1 Tax=Solanum pennellii TaxID=28526 RepID=A0ABM1H7D0_SOLPN|nr:uncharacterized protein LOC107025078 [Solanum pennellii]
MTKNKPFVALPANPTFAHIKSNNEENAKKSKAKSLIQNVVADFVRLLGEEFTDKRIVEKNLVTLHERIESKVSSFEKSKNLDKLSLGELMIDVQAQEQLRNMRREKFTEGAFSIQKQKGKQQYNQKNKGKCDGGNNSGDVKQ